MRPFAILLALAATVYLLAVWAPKAAGDEPPGVTSTVIGSVPPGDTTAPLAIVTVQAKVQGHDVRWWSQRAVYWHRRTISLHRTLMHNPTVTEAINLACTIYGNCAELWRKARCESHLYRYAANAHSSARGLFQFLTTPRGGTWGSTPFGRFSVFSPYANALAAGWMHANGRGGEWVCQ